MPITKLKFSSAWKVFAALCWMANPTSAAQFGPFTYTDNGTSITITDYTTSEVGGVDIPASIVGKPVTSIGSSAFYHCSGLTSVTIPSSVTSIGSYAFYYCSGLTSVTIPPSVTNIGSYAFYFCSGLTSVTIPSSVTSIGGAAFYGCSGLASVTIPSSVTSIGSSAFANCIGLTSLTIPSSVTSIGSSAFSSCSGLTSVTIPSSVISIGDYAFRSCGSLNTITVDASNSAYSSANGVLCNKSQTTLIQCPGGKTGTYSIPSSVTSIGSSAFYLCSGLTSVTIPSGVTRIGEDAFNNCIGLTSVTIPSSVTRIEGYAFYGCSGLTSVAIPSSVTIIGSGVFRFCGSLTAITVDPSNSVCSSADGVLFNKSQVDLIQCPGGKTGTYTIPSSVATIRDSAFHSCRYLTSVTMPSSVTYIGNTPFRSCSSLTAITVDPSNSVCSSADGVLFNKSQTDLIQCPGGKTGTYSIPSSVKNIDSYAFSDCGGLTSVTIPLGVTSIGSSAFYLCSGLTSVTIPSSVTSIGSTAFYGCSGLTSVTIPSSVTSIDSWAFRSCSGLTAITVDPSNSAYSSADGVLCNKSQTDLIQCPGGKTGTYSIPSGVTTIRDSAFSDCSGLTSVTIPSSVTSIGGSAFRFCSGLTSVMIPSSVTSIGSGGFYGCNGLTSVTIPFSVTSIGSSAFSYCSGLTAIMVDPSNSAYSSADGVLCNKSQTVLIQCPGGKTGTYSIPSSVTSIGSGAFYGCSGLTSVTIPSSITSIRSSAFSYCSGLGSAVFLGDAPSITPNNITGQSFAFNAIDFKVYFFEGKSGFTAPNWMGYPSVNMGAPSAISPWLISNGYPHDADIEADPDGDSVSLLLAYSLNLDPKQNLSGVMPQPVFTSNQMSIVFYAGSEGVSYRVESSVDLQSWSSAGVSISAPNINKFRTATVSSTGPSRFMRIVVDY